MLGATRRELNSHDGGVLVVPSNESMKRRDRSFILMLIFCGKMERAKGFEPSTPALARLRSLVRTAG